MGLRANGSAPMTLEDCEIPSELRLTEDDAGFKVMLEIALPPFNLGAAAVAGTAAHLKNARFEHLGQSLGESLPTLRAQLAAMQIDTDGLAARIDDLVELETKAAAGEAAIAVTSAAMRACGGRHSPGT